MNGSSVLPVGLIPSIEQQARSIPDRIVATLADLPNATANQGRSYIVRALPGVVFALDGAWIDSTGATVA